jgi:hypothetical protein
MAYTTIDDPSVYFQIALYTGNSGNQSITNDGNSDLQADWIWLKERSSTSSHHSFDSTRGVGDSGKALIQNSTGAEGDDTAFRSFDSDGFTLASTNGYNQDTITNVAWQWKANGGTTTSFSASGSQLAGTRQSNTTAGFSIITYTGDGNNNATIPHGLSSAPKFVIIKDRGNATNWYVGHDATFTTGEIFLNLNNAVAAAFGPFNKTAPTSSNIVLGTDGNVNGSSDTMICYAFAEVQGYSKFGSFTGNANADGPFIYTGFKPAWVMYKVSSTTEDWLIFDSKRIHSGTQHKYLEPNTSDAEGFIAVSLLSNGFKVTEASGAKFNSSGATYIYMAFAEHPFVSSEGVPVTAK